MPVTPRLRRHGCASLALAAALVSNPWPAARAGADCSITSVNLAFGAYDPLVTLPDDSTGSVTVTCSYVPPGATTASYTVSISSGTNSNSPTTRAMASGMQRLGYNVFSDAARSATWGNGTGGTVLVSGAVTVGPGAGNTTRTVTHTVYGRVPALQDSAPGSYVDTLVLTLTY